MLSVSGLCNNIGAYLLRHGDEDEAIAYLTHAVEDSKCESQRAGLVWFLRKLERQSHVEDTSTTATNAAVSTNDNTEYRHSCTSLQFIRSKSFTLQKLGRSTSVTFADNDVSCSSYQLNNFQLSRSASCGIPELDAPVRSNSIFEIPARGRSNSIVELPARGRSNSIVEIPTRRGSTGIVEPPTRGRSNSIVEIPTLHRSSSCVVQERESVVGHRASIVEKHHEPVSHEDTPLGFEYFNEALLVSKRKSSPSTLGAAGEAQREREHTEAIASMNLAYIQYADAITSEELENVLQSLKNAQEHLPYLRKKSCSFLNAIVHSNISVCYARISKPKEALQHIQEAYESLSLDDYKKFEDHRHSGTEDEAEEMIMIQRLYIHVSILLNYARLCVRINDLQKTNKLLDELETISEKIPRHQYHERHRRNVLINRMRWLHTVAEHFIRGMVHQRLQQLDDALILYRDFLAKARHELGHDHMHVATILWFKGMALFEQRNLHHAMLAQLASLRIHESRHGVVNTSITEYNEINRNHYEEMARIIYSVARTLHDREEYRDALRMYSRALELQKFLSSGRVSFDGITTMCNLARIHHIIGDIDASLELNYKIVTHAKYLAGPGANRHPFVADRLLVLGNVLVEAGKMEEAVGAFAEAARINGEESLGSYTPASPYDVDGRAAASLAKAGLQHPCAASA